MSIPLYAARAARFRLELVPSVPQDENDLLLAALAELGDPYEADEWDAGGFDDDAEAEHKQPFKITSC